MITINVKDNLADVTRDLTRAAREQLPFATALTLTRTAKALERELQTALTRVFDNPTPFIARGTFATAANKRELAATVGMRDTARAGGASPAQYVKEFFSGGARNMKPFERALRRIGALPAGYKAIPGRDLKTDRYGNPDRRLLAEIIGALSSKTSIHSGRGKRAALVGYFVVLPGASGRAAHFKQPGILRRIQRGAQRSVQSMFVFETTARYRKRLDLESLAQRVVNRDFATLFDAALTQALGKK